MLVRLHRPEYLECALLGRVRNENWSTIAQSQVRDRNACQPSARSRRKRVASSRTAGGTRIAAAKSAPSAKVAASIAIAQPGPAAATIAPPSAAPTTMLELIASRSSAFACWMTAAGTVWGMIPDEAGKKNADDVPLTALIATMCQSSA